MPTSEEVKAYFDAVARDWDRIRQGYYGAEVINKASAAAGLTQWLPHESYEPADSITKPRPVAQVLVDVGCGTGFLSAGLAGMAEKVIGVDASQPMLDVARENLQALDLHNVELLQGSVDHLPLKESAGDAVFANMVLHHAPDPQRMVQEMSRVAKPQGRVVITDMDSHTNEWFRVEMADIWLGFTEVQVRGYMEGAGLTDIEFGWVGTQ
jgi:ubiquinone/menaquinone biosynthesis C-methylase UbiE